MRVIRAARLVRPRVPYSRETHEEIEYRQKVSSGHGMGHSSREPSKHRREVVKSESFAAANYVEIMLVLTLGRITVQNPATGQNLTTYALNFSSPSACP
jgi:hypothetical protein